MEEFENHQKALAAASFMLVCGLGQGRPARPYLMFFFAQIETWCDADLPVGP
jgi:hypothetical protein